MNSKSKGILAILSAAFVYSFYGILSRMLYQTFDIFFQFWSRSLALSVIMLGVILIGKSWIKIDGKSLGWFLARGIIGTFSYVMTFVAVNHLEIGTTLFIFYAGSILGGYAIGAFLFKEGLAKSKLLALFLSLLGLYLIYSANLNLDKAIYVLIAFLCGLSTACWNTLSKKVTGKYRISQVMFMDCIVTAVILFIVSLLLGEHWELPRLTMPWMYNSLMLILVLCTGILIPYGFSRIEAQIGSLIMLVEVIFTVIFAFLFFRETIGLISILGGLMIVSAVIIPEINLLGMKKVIGTDVELDN